MLLFLGKGPSGGLGRIQETENVAEILVVQVGAEIEDGITHDAENKRK